MRGTASSERDGVVVTDRWGGSWQVRAHRVAVVPAPPAPPDEHAVRRLLLPWTERPYRPAAPAPAASWVLGRSTRWQGPDAPGAGDDPVADEARDLRLRVAALVSDGVPTLRGLVAALWQGGRALQTAQAEQRQRWLVQLLRCDKPGRWATWVVAGPEAVQAAVAEVAGAVGTGRVPDPAGARVVDVRDDRG